jgi:O-antigen/teichoic acid export membrane protein
VAQIVVFPLYARRFGEVGYGDLQYLMAFVNVLTVAVGTAANYARMSAPEGEREQNSGDYNLLLLVVAALGLPLTLLVRRFGGVAMDTPTYVCYYLLFVAMAFRYYADVAYKITLHYRRYFGYYLTIAVGYAVGAFLVWQTGIWPLGLLVGEALGVALAYLTCPQLHRRGLTLSRDWRRSLSLVAVLFLAEGVANLILNVDRILLKLLLGASAVTVYYLATLLGKTMSLLAVPLNGVLIGYLVRYNGKLTRRAMRGITLGSIGLLLLGTLACTVGGYLMLLLLYPAELAAVTPYLLVGSLSQVLYFTTSMIMVVLIRFAKKTYQIYINAVFGVAFVGLGVPATLLFSLQGFAVAMVIAGALRYLTALALGFWHVRKNTADTDGAMTA